MNKECSRGPETCGRKNNDCYLIRFIKLQSVGGRSIPERDRSSRDLGPYWTKTAWSEMTDRVAQQARSEGCPFEDKIPQVIINLTRQKERRGELF